MRKIIIKSQFGHEIMAVNFAKAFNTEVVIVPNKEEKAAYDEEAQKIYDNMSFFYNRMSIVPFEEKNNIAEYWDVIDELKKGTLDNTLWNSFASSKLTPEDVSNLPVYQGMNEEFNTLVIPQKLISDGECGISTEQQSLPLSVFDFIKGKNLVLGQHFHKENDLEKVKNLADTFGMYVPGMTENPEVFGIRGVQHKAYYNMYARLNASVGIAGTHTWILLTTFPKIPQIILFNNHGVERWKAIEKAYQAQGYNIHCIGFDENTDLSMLAQEIEKAYQQL